MKAANHSTLRKYDLVIFDWDGTLMDSIGKIIICIENMARALALPVPAEADIRNVIGLSMTQALQVLFPCGLLSSSQRFSAFPEEDMSTASTVSTGTEECYITMRAEFKTQYLHLDTTPTPIFDQAPQLLESLSTKGYQLAVATGKARAGLVRVWEQSGLGHYFIASRCADEAQSKPHPEMIISLLQELSIQPERALMVGDSLLDLTMAANAGIDSIGVTYGAHSEAVLRQAKPIALIDSPQQLLQHL
ncbi:HAD-IA family hydrolase [Shewanella xiamenensis]|uniref:HAD-IA family hydrolase n=1 Tax=Shewanella xiamenensis TaxID=332186 RepID=UPI00313B3724